MEFLVKIWEFEYAVIPCFIAYLFFDLPIIYRKITRRIYVPIYFAFFPYGYSDELYAKYFDEDYFYEVGGPYHNADIRRARIKILWVSVLSLTLTMAISPFLSALFSHYFLTVTQQMQFFYTLALVKAAMLVSSLYNLRWRYTISEVVPLKYIAMVYIAYWITLLTFFDRGLYWISKKYEIGGFNAIVNGLLDFFVYEIGVGILFVAIIGFLIPWRLTDGTAKPIKDDS